MRTGADKIFNNAYVAVCTAVFVLIALRAYFIPINHDEATTFFFYVQSGNYLPYKAHLYTNNHVLNSALAHLCYLVGGSHPFVLRIPNLMAFVLLCFGTAHFFRFLRHTGSKVMLATFFLLTFNFLDFFEMCRGYGLSMGLLVYGLALLQDYFLARQFRSLLWASLCIQAALAANLTFVMVTLLLGLALLVFQLRHRLLLELRNLVLQAANLGLLVFWIRFSLFYRKNKMLDSGWGDDYWEVAFRSLMSFVYGHDAPWLQGLVLFAFGAMTVVTLVMLVRRFSWDALFTPRYFYFVMLIGLVKLFFLLKLLLNVNYPEARTGLFFYLFFALALVCFIDQAPQAVSIGLASVFSLLSLGFFVRSYDLSNFTNAFYHVMPDKLFTHLVDDSAREHSFFTVGGNLDREMNYSFINYRHGAPLNLMDVPERMHMNCDYYYASKREQPYYRYFYDEVEQDERWGRVLLKRRYPIQRKPIGALERHAISCATENEFVELLRFDSTALRSANCIEADVTITFNQVPKPFKAFLVLAFDNRDQVQVGYKRSVLSWLADDLDHRTFRFKLTSAPIPADFKSGIVYIWNIDRKKMDLTVNHLKIAELDAPGINFSIPASYYQFIKKNDKQIFL